MTSSETIELGGGVTTSAPSILKEVATSFAGVGSTLAGIMTAVRLLKQEAEDLKTREQQSAEAQQRWGEAVRSMSANFSDDKTLALDRLEGRLLDASRRTGAAPDAVTQAASAAFSAKGALSHEAAVLAVEAGFRVNPADQTGATELASRALDIMGASGVTDPRAAVGLLTQAGGAARVTDLSKLGKNLTPAIAAMMGRGDTLEQAVESYVTTTLLASDSEGAVSSTGTINLANRLAGFIPQTTGKDKRGKFNVPQKQIDAYLAAGSTTARKDLMRSMPELRRAFWATNSFDAQTQGPFEQLLSGDANAMAMERSVQQSIGDIGDGVQAFESKVGQMESLPSQFLLKSQRSGNSAKVQALLQQTRDASEAEARRQFDETLGMVDFPVFQSGGPMRWGRAILGGDNAWNRQQSEADVQKRIAFGQDAISARANELEAVRGSLGGGADPAIVEALNRTEAVLRQMATHMRSLDGKASVGKPPEHALGRQ